ncbi:hypothetical protein FSP39_007559 [Pinctada imbricata]|uniref:CCHC-type domain-containing protein n=1 Tax=Pinctada imbricata TaxID=66713 RepID=A0AA88YHT3_PINIB|nr:hypothetical protein FSP39_007559 [Pinctada imbricata]
MSETETPIDECRSINPDPETSAFAAFDLFKSYLDTKLNSFKRDIIDTTESNSTEVAKKVRAESSFKFEGNKRQYEFNETLRAKIKTAQRAVNEKDVSSVKRIFEEIDSSLHKRNKCIKLADKSPAGWDTVREYLSDELASDSEDEKKIRNAESRAMRIKKQRWEKRLRGNRVSTPRNTNNSDRTPSATITRPDQSFRGYKRSYGVAKPTDICFACTQSGHWRKDCPKLKNESTGASK